MKDRIPTYPGRIELTDVETGVKRKYDMTMADEPTQEGDAPVKEKLLKDNTAQQYGRDSNTVVDDILYILREAVIRRNGVLQTILGEEIKFPSIEFVSYHGDNTSGAEHPTSVRLKSRPDLFVFFSYQQDGKSYELIQEPIAFINVKRLSSSFAANLGPNTSYQSAENSFAKYNDSQNELSWYYGANYGDTAAKAQFNFRQYTYYCFALKGV